MNSGDIAEIILMVMLLEVAVVGLLVRRRHLSFDFRGYLAGLAAGCFLVLALRAALIGSGWIQIAIFLGFSLLAHSAEMIVRLFVSRHTSSTAHPHVKPQTDHSA